MTSVKRCPHCRKVLLDGKWIGIDKKQFEKLFSYYPVKFVVCRWCRERTLEVVTKLKSKGWHYLQLYVYCIEIWKKGNRRCLMNNQTGKIISIYQV